MDTSTRPGLPEGLTTRPLTMADARAVYEAMAAQERHDIGVAAIEPADIVSDWQRPGFDVEARTVGVFDGEQMVGYAEVGKQGRCDTAVLPEHRGRGIGTWLALWTQDLGRELGEPLVGMPVPEGSAGAALLESLGYEARWNSWVLALPEGASIPDRPLPAGYSVRAAADDELRAAHDTIEDAFLEWSDRARESYEDFEATVLKRPDFERWNLRVCLAPDGAVVGTAVVHLDVHSPEPTGFVDRLAVRRDQRHQGLAQALLADAFAVAREHGALRSELSTDSRTGALDLYLKVGMVVTSNWVNRAKRL